MWDFFLFNKIFTKMFAITFFILNSISNYL